VMRSMGYGDVLESTLKDILSEATSNNDGVVELKEFLEIAAGAKQVHLHTAFSRLIEGYVPTGTEEEGGQKEESPKKGQPSWFSRRIPVEKSGGGV